MLGFGDLGDLVSNVAKITKQQPPQDIAQDMIPRDSTNKHDEELESVTNKKMTKGSTEKPSVGGMASHKTGQSSRLPKHPICQTKCQAYVMIRMVYK